MGKLINKDNSIKTFNRCSNKHLSQLPPSPQFLPSMLQTKMKIPCYNFLSSQTTMKPMKPPRINFLISHKSKQKLKLNSKLKLKLKWIISTGYILQSTMNIEDVMVYQNFNTIELLQTKLINGQERCQVQEDFIILQEAREITLVKTWHGQVLEIKLNQPGLHKLGTMKLMIQVIILTDQDIKVEQVTLHKLFGRVHKSLVVLNTITTLHAITSQLETSLTVDTLNKMCSLLVEIATKTVMKVMTITTMMAMIRMLIAQQEHLRIAPTSSTVYLLHFLEDA